MASAAVMGITKWSISGSEKSVPAKDQQSKRSRSAAIVPSYQHYVTAYSPGRVHRAVPPTKTDTLPYGSHWLHEIKRDGFRVTGSAFYRLALACGEPRPS